MIPILYDKSDTNYTHNGFGFLTDIISCRVTEERNGAYECAFTYPISGRLYSDIAEGGVIKVKANETSDLQLFRIYSHSKPINGIVTFHAEHISYDANGIPLAGFSASAATPQAAIARAISEGAFTSPFTAWSDISSLNSISIKEPCSLRALLGGQRGSILDVWGGEYEFDNYTIKLHQHRGADNGVTIEYGKNLTDVTQERNITDTYTHILPYATYNSDTNGEMLVTLTEKVLPLTIAENVGHQKAFIVNFTDKFAENEPVTEQALRIKATAFVQSNSSLGTPKVNIKASFVSLWQTEEYKNIAPLERVKLCDTVTVRFIKLGVSAKAKVIKTVYDTISERYDSVEIGDVQSSFADTVIEQNKAITDLTEVVSKGFSDATAEIQAAIAEATAAITGNSGGYVVLHPGEHPQEILIMDSPNIATAVHVWRWNASGLGYSSTGYNGTYGLAMTMNGAIVADYITAGTLNGGLLRADSVQANAISAGFKQTIADNINSAKTTVEQEFAIADAQLASTIYTKTETDTRIGAAEAAANGYTDTQLSGYYTKTETETKISQSASAIMLGVYTKTETDTRIGTAQTAAETAANGYTDTQLGGYYTKSETDAAISVSASAIMLGGYTKTETDTRIGTAQTAAETAANGYTDTQLSSYSTTVEMNSAITATATSITTEVNKKVGKTEFGTYMQQNYNSFLIGFNNASTTLQLTANGLTVYDGAISNNDKLFALNQSGMQIYLDGDHIGNIGTSDFVGTNDHGVTFQLDTDGYYMMWSRKINSGDTSYTAALTYTRGSMNGSFTEGEGVYVSVPFYVHDKATINSLEVKGRADFDSAAYFDSSITVSGRTYATNGITVTGGTSSFSEDVSISSGATLSAATASFTNASVTVLTLKSTEKIQTNENHTVVKGYTNAIEFGDSSIATNVYGAGTQIEMFVNSQDSNKKTINFKGDIVRSNARFYMNDGNALDIANDSGLTMRGNRVLGWANSRVDFGISNDTAMTIHTSQLRIDSRYLVLNGMRGECQIGFATSGTTDMTGQMSWSYCISYDPTNNVATFYGNTASSSDLRKKRDVSNLSEKYLNFIRNVNPVSFKFVERKKDGFHSGFIAQDILKALADVGLTKDDFAGFIDINGDGTEYALMYNEFIAPMLMYIKHLESRIETIERTG